MTHKEKELLLKDLCMRLPYGVMAKFGDSKPSKITSITQCIDSNSWFVESDSESDGMMCEINNIKPYLFPISSMTEEQNLEYLSTCKGGNANMPTLASFEWCIENNFDIHNLIPMGLAIDATGKNIISYELDRRCFEYIKYF